ncbi:MAG: hypothetical protein V3V71_19225, partial [Roseateles sp.]
AAEAQRRALLDTARAALRRGDPDAAWNHLQAAANMSHAADTELLILHAQLQRGDFRQAMGFAAHAAVGHADEPEALALYVWLLALNEQNAYASRLLEQGLARALEQPRLLALRADLARWQDGGAALSPGPRPQPVASGPADALPLAEARQLGSGLLLGDGDIALVPSESLGARQSFWVRNGLGQTRRAEPAPTTPALSALGLSLLRLTTPLPAVPLARAPRDAFAGSPAAAVMLLDSDSADPAWPALRSGFVGRVGREAQALGFDLPHGTPGGPVLDNAGRLIGIARMPTGQPPQLLPLSRLLATGDAALNRLPAADKAARLEPDRLYELALPFTLQVLGH